MCPNFRTLFLLQCTYKSNTRLCIYLCRTEFVCVGACSWMSSLLEVAWANFTQTNSDFNWPFFYSPLKGHLKPSFGNLFTSNTFSAFSGLFWQFLPVFLCISRLNSSSFPQRVSLHLSLFLPLRVAFFCFFFLPLPPLVLSSPVSLWSPPSSQHTFTHLQYASSISLVEFSQLPFPLSVSTYHRTHNNIGLLLSVCVQASISV